MSEALSTHPTADELRALSLGQLGEAELARVSAHLGDCPACCRRIDELAAADPLLARLQQTAGRRDEALVSPARRRSAVRALRRAHAARAAKRSDDAATEPVILPAPQRVGDYDILAEAGRGGMGVEYKARHRGLRRPAALKMVLAGEFASPAQKVRFRLEAELAARVQHPNIVPVYEIGSYQGRPFLALEWVEGGSLADRLDGRPWPPGAAAALVETLARAIHVAHVEGVVHRDLKPANILLQESEGGRRMDQGASSRPGFTADSVSGLLPKITDFGLARPTEGGVTVTQSGLLVGTPGYMAPEQADSSGRRALVGPATDIYALGVILYQLLTGQLPFQGDSTLEVLRAVTSDEPVRPRRWQPRLPRDLEAITLHCLEKEPTRRYPSALALADDLQQFREGKPVAARPVGLGARLARACRRRPLVVLLLVLLTASLFGGLAGVARMWRKAESNLREADRQRDEADRQRAAAEAAQAQAKGEANRALTAEQEMRRQWYAASSNLMQLAWDTGQVGRLRALLAETEAYPNRGFEWYYWQRLCHLDQHTLIGHRSAVRSVSWSPDGTRLATGSYDGTAKVWDAAGGRERLTLRAHTNPVDSVSWSPDGTHLATGSEDDTAKVWDAAGAAAVQQWARQDRAVQDLLDSDDFRSPQAQGFLQSWLLRLPLPIASGESGAQALDRPQLADEAQLRPRPGDRALVGRRPSLWQEYRSPRAVVDFNAVLGRVAERSVAYAVCYIESDRARDGLWLQLGSDDQAKVYLNGREIYRIPHTRTLWTLDTVGPVGLKPGINVLLFKVVNETGQWEGCARLVDDAGRPVQGLRVKLTP